MTIGWQRGIYPIRATAETAVSLGDLFVLEDGGKILAAGRINQRQVPEYADAEWLYKAADDEVWVLHTLVVDAFRKRTRLCQGVPGVLRELRAGARLPRPAN